MARRSCGYQPECWGETSNPRVPPSLLTQEHPDPCLPPAPPSSPGHSLPGWSTSISWLGPAVEKLQFPQECLEFPPLCNTRLQVPALMREYLHFPGEYSHTRAVSLNNPSHHSKPKADELLFLFSRAFKTLKYFFKVCMF